jgi:hypothetical protein
MRIGPAQDQSQERRREAQGTDKLWTNSEDGRHPVLLWLFNRSSVPLALVVPPGLPVDVVEDG